MTQPQPIDLDAIEQRIPHYDGPWTFELDDDNRHWVVLYPSDSPLAGLIATVPDYGYELAEFIAAARQDVPAMAAEIRRLRTELTKALAVLDDGPQWLNDRVQQHWSVPARSAAEILREALNDVGGLQGPEDREPCGEGHCRCDHYGEQHGPCGCDCPRDDYGQLIHEG